MSGGSYDYLYGKLDEHSHWHSSLEDMARRCREWSTGEGRELTKCVDGKWVPFTIEDRAHVVLAALRLEVAAKKLRAAHEALKDVEDLMHDVEWIASCDYGVDALLPERQSK